MPKFLGKSLLTIIFLSAPQALAQAPASNPKAAPSPSPADVVTSLDLGQLVDDNYTNGFFGLSLSVPHKWVVDSAQKRADIAAESKKIVRASEPNQQTQVIASIERSTTLLSLTKLPPGQSGNASFMLIAERIPSPTIKDGQDVLRSMERIMKGTNFTVEFQGDIRTERVSNADFGVATIKNSSPYGVFWQKIYVTVKNGYALQLFFTYRDDSDLAPFDGIIKSIKLN